MRDKIRRSIISAGVLGAGVVALLPFQNCAPATRAPLSANASLPAPSIMPVDDAPTNYANEFEAAAAPFSAGKVQLGAMAARTAGVGKMESDRLLPGTRLIAILDNECVRQAAGPISVRAYSPDREFAGLKSQSYLWILDEPVDRAELDRAAEADPCVIGLSRDDVARAGAGPMDPKLGNQWNFLSAGGAPSYGFFRDDLRGATADVVVAVVDSGIAFNHEDLKDVLWKESDVLGYNFRMNSTNVYDDFGHGTLVSGIIGAKADNGVGIVGTMGHHLKLMTLKVQDSTGQAFISDITRAVDYARTKAVDVINISMEGTGSQPALQAALNSAVTNGIFVAVAAGNGDGSGNGISISDADAGSSAYVIPAVFASALNGMMAVGAIDSVTGARSRFSNYNPSFVEIAAPGSNGVYSTDRSGSYSNTQGTSFASPMVAGAGALVISFFKKNGIAYTAATVESTIAAAAVKKSGLASSFNDGRVLNLKALSEYLRRTYLTPVDGGFNEN